MHKAKVYVEGVKYSFIGLAVGWSSAIMMGGVVVLSILSGSGLKGLRSGFWDLRPNVHQIDFIFLFFKIYVLDLTKQSSD